MENILREYTCYLVPILLGRAERLFQKKSKQGGEGRGGGVEDMEFPKVSNK